MECLSLVIKCYFSLYQMFVAQPTNNGVPVILQDCLERIEVAKKLSKPLENFALIQVQTYQKAFQMMDHNNQLQINAIPSLFALICIQSINPETVNVDSINIAIDWIPSAEFNHRKRLLFHSSIAIGHKTRQTNQSLKGFSFLAVLAVRQQLLPASQSRSPPAETPATNKSEFQNRKYF